jgi:hypothetical protein
MRQNALLCAMQCDLGFNYNRLGISLQGATWGMPAVLKPTVGIAWSLDGDHAQRQRHTHHGHPGAG